MYLYGASGHGKVIKDILEVQGRKVDGFVDDDPSINELSGLPVLHSAENSDEVIVSIGVSHTRKKIVEKLNCKIADAVIHPSAIISKTVEIGEGSVVMAGTVINAEVKIGKHCIINTGATVDHECLIGDYAHIAPGVHLCGQVHVGVGTLIGVGSSVIPCIHIGKWCTIGAGAAIVEDVPDYATVVGVPGRIIKKQG
jgi:sugar O-acyltransferase (sialic acid O-acetyltransferase NeuD family)